MIRAILLGVVSGIVFLAVYIAIHTGYFREVEISEKKAGPFHLLYKEHVGPYHKIVPLIEEVESWAKSHGIDCHESFGLYLDSPKAVEEPRLRSKGGCIVPSLPNLDLPEGFKTELWPAADFVVAQFSGSPGIGPFKVYPAVFDYMEDRRLPFQGWNVLEVYEIKDDRSMTTTYYFPLQTPAHRD